MKSCSYVVKSRLDWICVNAALMGMPGHTVTVRNADQDQDTYIALPVP